MSLPKRKAVFFTALVAACFMVTAASAAHTRQSETGEPVEAHYIPAFDNSIPKGQTTQH